MWFIKFSWIFSLKSTTLNHTFVQTDVVFTHHDAQPAQSTCVLNVSSYTGMPGRCVALIDKSKAFIPAEARTRRGLAVGPSSLRFTQP